MAVGQVVPVQVAAPAGVLLKEPDDAEPLGVVLSQTVIRVVVQMFGQAVFLADVLKVITILKATCYNAILCPLIPSALTYVTSMISMP